MNILADRPLLEVDDKLDPAPDVFDRWAEVYDHQSNPFLSLEHRVVSGLLPDLSGKDVLDAGCGTGRMLRLLQSKAPCSLLGVDHSQEMLRKAKSIEGAMLRLGHCDDLPVDDGCIDFVLCSFVLSYLRNLDAFADEMARIVRVGATVLLTDVHPVTEAFFNWRRSFRSGDKVVSVASAGWKLQQIVATFEARGFRREVHLEVPFSAPEKDLFAKANRPVSYEEIGRRSAIYVLAFRRCDADRNIDPRENLKTIFENGRVALSAWDTSLANITTCEGRIEALTDEMHDVEKEERQTVDIDGYLVFPGLINAHDHLEFGLYPRLGRGHYQNAVAWAEDIHTRDAETIARHREIPREISVWWGLVRNLLSGVTTVCHHNPIAEQMKRGDLPLNVIQEFDWAHSLAFDADLRQKSIRSDEELPFIFHAAEGVDGSAHGEMKQLLEGDALRKNSVMVHGLALKAGDMQILNQRGASLISCPSSNQFLFNSTLDASTLEGVDRLALGSDSPLTAEGDLLDELRFATTLNMNRERLYAMVTTSSADVLCLKAGEGRLAIAGVADFIAIADKGASAAQTLCVSSWRDIELVVCGGRIVLASAVIYSRLIEMQRQGLEPLLVDGEARFVRAPLEEMLRGATPVMDGPDVLLAGKRVRDGRSA